MWLFELGSVDLITCRCQPWQYLKVWSDDISIWCLGNQDATLWKENFVLFTTTFIYIGKKQDRYTKTEVKAFSLSACQKNRIHLLNFCTSCFHCTRFHWSLSRSLFFLKTKDKFQVNPWADILYYYNIIASDPNDPSILLLLDKYIAIFALPKI